MAVAELIVSRRALLAAACAAPLVSAHPEQACPELRRRASSKAEIRVERPLPPLQRWNRAILGFEAAEAALAAAAHTEDETLYDRLGSRHDAALKKLLRTPAPAAAALALKLELVIEHLAWELTGGECCMAALLHDARSLAAIAA